MELKDIIIKRNDQPRLYSQYIQVPSILVYDFECLIELLITTKK